LAWGWKREGAFEDAYGGAAHTKGGGGGVDVDGEGASGEVGCDGLVRGEQAGVHGGGGGGASGGGAGEGWADATFPDAQLERMRA